MKLLSGDMFDLEFNNWLAKNAVWLSISVAAIIFIIVGVLFILSKRKNRS